MASLVIGLLKRMTSSLEAQQEDDPTLDLFRLWVHPVGGITIIAPGHLPPDGFRGDVVEVLARGRSEAREVYWSAQELPEAETDPVERQRIKRARRRLRRINR